MGKTLCVPDEVPAPKYYCKECDRGRPTLKNINGIPLSVKRTEKNVKKKQGNKLRFVLKKIIKYIF